jgi:hypothetical protein
MKLIKKYRVRKGSRRASRYGSLTSDRSLRGRKGPVWDDSTGSLAHPSDLDMEIESQGIVEELE